MLALALERQRRGHSSLLLRENPSGADRPILVDTSSLKQIRVKDTLRDYLAALFARRHYIVADARSKALRSEHDLWLGRAWLFLQPALDALLYALLFGVILKTAKGVENFPGFLILGITFFSILSKALTSGTTVVRSSKGLIGSFNFPRALVVLSQSLKNFYDSIPTVLVAVIIALALQWSKPLSWTVLLVVPLFLLVHVFAVGIMFICGRLCAQIPDLRIPINLGQRAWMMLSGIFFSIERFVNHPALLSIMTFNPAYQFLTAVRDVVLYATAPSMGTWLKLISWSVGTLVFGFIFFWKAEEKYVNVK